MITREDAVRQLTTRHLLLTADSRLMAPTDANLELLTDTQRALVGMAAPSTAGLGTKIDEAMRNLRLGTPEPASDKGHFRFHPRGALVRRLLQDWLERYVVQATGGVEIQTPMLFRWSEEYPLHDLAGSFHQLLYHVTDGVNGRSQAIMRYGADPGFFSMMRDIELRPEQFPYHVYELTNCFRRHKTGEVASILRARAVTFYDHHALCLDKAQGRDEFIRMLREQRSFLGTTGRRYDLQFTVVEDQLPDLLPTLTTAVAEFGTDAFLTVLSEAKHYYSVVSNFCDPHGMHTTQIQLDHANARRFGLAGCPQRYPDLTVLHMSSGAVERWLVSFLRDCVDQPRTAALPLWLAPTQVRVIPVSDAERPYAWRVRDQLDQLQVRADIDDRSQSLRHRLAAAAREWVPRVAVVGRREIDTGRLDVLDRPATTRSSLFPAELAASITATTRMWPYRAVVERSVASRPRYR